MIALARHLKWAIVWHVLCSSSVQWYKLDLRLRRRDERLAGAMRHRAGTVSQALHSSAFF